MLQRLSFGAALLATFTLACSDDETSGIMAQGPKTASAAESRSARSRHEMNRDERDQMGTGAADLSSRRAIRRRAG